MHLTVLVPCILIVILGADLLGGILNEGKRRLQSKQRRDSLRRWISGAQVSH
jgi:hypothetical protein